jgi:hypothetical protein
MKVRSGIVMVLAGAILCGLGAVATTLADQDQDFGFGAFWGGVGLAALGLVVAVVEVWLGRGKDNS